MRYHSGEGADDREIHAEVVPPVLASARGISVQPYSARPRNLGNNFSRNRVVDTLCECSQGVVYRAGRKKVAPGKHCQVNPHQGSCDRQRTLSSNMKLSNSSTVPVYTVSGSSTSRSLPEWLSQRRNGNSKSDPEYASRVELLQDFEFEEASSCVRISEDGEWVMSTGERGAFHCELALTVTCRHI